MFPAAFRFLLLGFSAVAASFPTLASDSAQRTAPTRPAADPSTGVSAVIAVEPKTVSTSKPAASASKAAVLASSTKSAHTATAPAISYVGASEIARALKLKPTWDSRARRLTLSDERVRLVLELDRREAELNGVRVFLGAPTVLRGGELAVTRTDFQRFLTPAIRPGQGEGAPPAVKKIVLDPGHGGRDTGKVHAGQKVVEKEMTLDTARRLKVILEAQGFAVVLTRNDDRFLDLAERPEIAARVGADLFISLHFNAVESEADRVTGVEVYTMTPQHQLSTARQSDDHVPVFNPGNANDHWNTVLGAALHRELVTSLKASDRGLKRGRYAVLRLARCPAVLIEGGFLSHDGEARRIATPEYRQQIAAAIAAGVRNYAGTLEGLRAHHSGSRPTTTK